MEKENTLQDHLECLLGDGVYRVMLINKMGRIETEAARRNIVLPYEKREVFSMGFRLHQSLLSEFDDEFGQVEYFVINRKKAKIVAVPFGQRSLISVMDRDSDHYELVKKIETIRRLESAVGMAEAIHLEAVAHG